MRTDRLVPRRRRRARERHRHPAQLIGQRLGLLGAPGRGRHQLARPGRRAADAADPRRIGQVAQHAQRETGRLDRIHDQVVDGALEEFGVGRHLLALPLDGNERERLVGRVVGHQLQHDHAGGTVDRRVMELREHGPPAVAEALDDIDLPEGVAAIHVAPDDARDLLGQLVGGAGRGEADLADVVIEVEVGVVHPVRVIEPEGHVDDAATQWREVADHRPDALTHRVVRPEIGRRALVDRQPVDVPVGRRCLHVEERRVETGELLHMITIAMLCVRTSGDRTDVPPSIAPISRTGRGGAATPSTTADRPRHGRVRRCRATGTRC